MPKSLEPKGRRAAGPARTEKVGQTPPAKKKASKKAPAKATKSSIWIRNLHAPAGPTRFDLMFSDRRIELAPRGRIGDLMQTTEEMREDPRYIANKDLLFEEITKEQAADILNKQNINAQSYRGPNPMDFITNEKGEKYRQIRAVVEPSAESQGIVVGQVDTPNEDGSGTHRNLQMHRQSGAPPQVVNVPGSQQFAPQDFDPNQMPAGLTVQQAGLFIETPPEQRWALLQRFQEEGAHGLGLTTVVDPVEREE